MAAEIEQQFKLLLIGDSQVGKSNLLQRYSDDTFSETYLATIGIDFKIRTLQLDGKAIKLQIWDTAGQERFRTITSSYYRTANGFMVVFDVTQQATFDNLAKWLDEIATYGSADAPKLLIGNKCDLKAQQVVESSTAKEFAAQHGMEYFETSAKSFENVEQAFAFAAGKLKSFAGPV